MDASRFICVHSHFYQPPREDPWLDEVLSDPTAAPSHDWNTRITDECYRPNRAARLMDSSGRIVSITNNYEYMNFNVGPTLHSWIEKHDPALSSYIVKSDGIAASRMGEGGAIAQAYNHIILPLSSERDIRTQVLWGIKDFEYRFGRKPKGMWLPETAVNTASLEVLASCGIEFTILAPHQCTAVKAPDGDWRQTPGGIGLDVTRPYFMRLPSGKTISLVFYYGNIAHDIAFGGLLNNGDRFAEALLSQMPSSTEPRLLTIATDGETYGHHHRFGEMALAQAIDRINSQADSKLTNVASFLKSYPAKWECKIAENTSWSCAHGVERWRSNCGCHTGGGDNWHQKWRAPLRNALDAIRDRIDQIYEDRMSQYCPDPWRLRDVSIGLYLKQYDDSAAIDWVRDSKSDFLSGYCGVRLAENDLKTALTLIEMQRMRMFMYTSCGWFFNDIAGIETSQILAYALRAVEYAKTVAGVDLADNFIKDLGQAVGNTEEFPTGRVVMEKTVLPARRAIHDIAAGAALLSKKESYYAYRLKPDIRNYPSGIMNLRVANMSVSDIRTLESWQGSAAVISTGGLDDVCRLSLNTPTYEDIWRNYYEGDITKITKYFESAFEIGSWHFDALTRDDKAVIATERMKYAESGHLEHAQDLLDDNRRLLVQLKIIGAESSPFLSAAVAFVFNSRVRDLASKTDNFTTLLLPGSQLEVLMEEAANVGVTPDLTELAPRMEKELRELLIQAHAKKNEDDYKKFLNYWRKALEFKIGIDKWRLQNRLWDILEDNKNALSDILVQLADELGMAIHHN